MIDNICKVEFPYVYDMFYRAKHSGLEQGIYSLEFLDWVMAGMAYNAYEATNPARKIAYFAELYSLVKSRQYFNAKDKMCLAVIRFYEDLFKMYQLYLRSQLNPDMAKRGTRLSPPDLIILPSFESTADLFDLLGVDTVSIGTYSSKYLEEFKNVLSTIYAEEDSVLFRCASMYYDYGVKRQGNGVILEVV